ncbi:geminin [Exaiptasia diaphana]|uniref:Geminin n=1 Tax=Exaiptasia diaphana TaxID=2652724 RepID=A0A913Y7E6_EXADI|nr:geminin [Exaiptasia diaphana]
MASFERVGSWVDIHQDCVETTEIPDENTPLSPEEGQNMRNHSKLSTKIYSPSRKSGKSTGFTVYGSPSMTKVGKSSNKGGSERRKTLQVLQPAADGKGVLVGSGGALRRQQKKHSSKPKVKDHLTQRTLKDCTPTTATESSDSDSSAPIPKSVDVASDEAYELMIKEPAPERYWQMLAEERRVALHEALEENQKLCNELDALKERCKKLEEVASQAEYFASLYSMVMEGEAPNLDDSDPIEAANEENNSVDESYSNGEEDTP